MLFFQLLFDQADTVPFEIPLIDELYCIRFFRHDFRFPVLSLTVSEKILVADRHIAFFGTFLLAPFDVPAERFGL